MLEKKCEVCNKKFQYRAGDFCSIKCYSEFIEANFNKIKSKSSKLDNDVSQ